MTQWLRTTAIDNFPIAVESLVVKIYKFFHIYTVRVTELKQFCDFVDIEYQKILLAAFADSFYIYPPDSQESDGGANT